MGTAIRVWLNASGVGVRTAATIKAIKMAYLLFFANVFVVTKPKRVAKIIKTGSSNTIPNARRNLRQKSTYCPTESMGIMKSPTLYVKRNPMANGRTIKKQKAAPIRKRVVVTRVNGTTYFSLFYEDPEK